MITEQTNDTRRFMNDLSVVISTLSPEIDLTKLSLRLEEVSSNYNIQRKSQENIENDLKENIDMFLAARSIEGLSNKTLDGYKMELNVFSKFINKPTVQINTSDIRKYLASNSKWMASTVDRKLSVLKTFFGWLNQEEILLRNPAEKIKAPKKPKRLPKGLGVEELEIVRESCETLRQRALIEVMYSTGCRLSEIANMKRSDINNQSMSLKVIGKGDKERVVYLSIKALLHLKKYLKRRTDNCDYLFVTERKPHRKMCNRTIQDEIGKIEKLSKISKKLTPHVMRHTFANLSMDAGIELTDLQHLMGHSNPSTTLVYASVSEERKKQAFKKYHVL